MNKEAEEFIRQSVCVEIAHIIRQHEGAEVFFVGWVDRYGIVSEIEAVAFGNDESVPAPLAEGLRGDLVIHNHPSGDLRASNPDIQIASLLAMRKLGFYIIDNSCEQLNIVYKPKPRIFLEENQVLDLFRKDGLLAKTIGSYEERFEQEQLVQKIVSVINDDQILLAEAGTGTGKSLSYLIPIALWAVQADKRVLITTHTINLQNQIAKKDVELVAPIVEKVTGIRPRFAVLVGRNNYICPKMVDELVHDTDKSRLLFDNHEAVSLHLEMIMIWLEKTTDGLRSSLPERIPHSLWDEISASTPNCPRKECPFYSSCFYYKARMAAEASHIIIGNHALLLSAIDEEQGFIATLPHFSGLVLDEGHHLEDTALRAMADEFSFGGIAWRLSRLFRRNADRSFGQLSLLRDRSGLDAYPELSELFYSVTERIIELSSTLKQRELLFRESLKGLEFNLIELDLETLAKPSWKQAVTILNDLFDSVRGIEVLLTSLLKKTTELFAEERILEILKVAAIHNDALLEMRRTFEKIFNLEEENTHVKQMELSSNVVRFSVGPAEVGDFLAKHIFRVKDFTVATSATLSVEGEFDYFIRGVGLNFVQDRAIESIILPSPFDYKNQMAMLVFEERNISPQKVESEKINLLREAILAVGGGTLILFTSYKALDSAYERLAPDFSQAGLFPMSQKEFSREELLQTMHAKDYTVIFATASFWEGIDVPGDHLRFLVIDKLPFDNPSDPLFKAKSKILQAQGKNPFQELSIPRALLRFKQGIGRLIRSKKDKGVLLVLDGRIFSKFYGKYFINTAKPAKTFSLAPKEILRYIAKFFRISFPF